MNEKEVAYPNVRLQGKRNKQKGEADPAQLKYSQKNTVNRNNQ